MIAGALAMVADVTVYASQGTEVRRFQDGVFAVVELGTDSGERTESERRLAGVEYLAGRSSARPLLAEVRSHPGRLGELVGNAASAHWGVAESMLPEAPPDLALVADYQQGAAVQAATSRWPRTPVVVVPLVPAGASLLVPAFASTLNGAALALVFTDAERSAFEGATKVPTRRISVPMTSNPSVLRGPHERVGERDYIVVISGSRWDSSSVSASQALLLVARFPDQTFAVSASDALAVFSGGQAWYGEAVGRGTDLLRLMAWASATIDLRPGPLLARRCLESLVHGTPILVPAESRGREHAQLGRGGLWFQGAPELFGATEALFAPTLQETLRRQSREYLDQRCRTTDGFADDVLSALGAVTDVLPASSVADLNVS
jgi:hypothetical protein